ncbi:MAG: radical SAM protein [Deltaproteobacteria bacterium]|nr:radical SAM protein [Deltaproteobacteria bacterium]
MSSTPPPLASPGVRARAKLVTALAQTWWRRPAGPTRVVLDLTRRCNLRCAMCHTWSQPVAHELTPAEIGAFLRQCPELVWLDLTGGEPFLRSDIGAVFDAVVTHARALLVLHFQSNGWFTARVLDESSRLRERLRARGGDAGELIVTISVDGPAALHDRIRGRPGSFARAVATADGLRARGIDVHVGTTLTRHNAGELEATWAALREALPWLERRRWHLNAMQLSQHFYGNAALAELRVPVAAALRRHAIARGVPHSLTELMESLYVVNLAAIERGEPAGIRCQALRSTVFVSPEGELLPCHIYDRPLGNVREHDLRALWRSEHVRRVRADIDRLACGGCFSACEAYPALAGAPLATLRRTVPRTLALLRRDGDG